MNRLNNHPSLNPEKTLKSMQKQKIQLYFRLDSEKVENLPENCPKH
jgi:DNA-binding transcriptional regulator WhiA